MNEAEFAESKEKLKGLVRKSILFGPFPENLKRLEEEIDKVEHTIGSEKLASYFISFFEELEQELAPTIEIFRALDALDALDAESAKRKKEE